jgi:hypothetical protein
MPGFQADEIGKRGCASFRRLAVGGQVTVDKLAEPRPPEAVAFF